MPLLSVTPAHLGGHATRPPRLPDDQDDVVLSRNREDPEVDSEDDAAGITAGLDTSIET